MSMIALSSEAMNGVASMGNLCRVLTFDVRRPALARINKIAISVGTDGSVTFYATDWNIFNAQFTIDHSGAISWTRNDVGKELSAMIDAFCDLVMDILTQSTAATFEHWCSVCCSKNHDT